jgi:hypothetical protein
MTSLMTGSRAQVVELVASSISRRAIISCCSAAPAVGEVAGRGQGVGVALAGRLRGVRVSSSRARGLLMLTQRGQHKGETRFRRRWRSQAPSGRESRLATPVEHDRPTVTRRRAKRSSALYQAGTTGMDLTAKFGISSGSA